MYSHQNNETAPAVNAITNVERQDAVPIRSPRAPESLLLEVVLGLDDDEVELIELDMLEP